jgi:hypothetical protein
MFNKSQNVLNSTAWRGWTCTIFSTLSQSRLAITLNEVLTPYSMNRNSMPVTGYDISSSRYNDELPGFASVLGHIDTTKFLFGSDDEKPAKPNGNPAVDSKKTYLHMNTTDDKFPILVRREGDSLMQFSASSAALDLATSQSPGPDNQANGWSNFNRHRAGQQSLPMNTFRLPDDLDLHEDEDVADTPKTYAHNRRSIDVGFSPFTDPKRSSLLLGQTNGTSSGMPKLQSSFSTNDIPTVKNTNGLSGSGGINNNSSAVNSHAEQYLHKHNASMGRIPVSAMNTQGDGKSGDRKSAYQPLQSMLQASAAPFGPTLTSSAASPPTVTATSATNTLPSSYNGNAPYYGGYAMSMGNMPLSNPQMPMVQQPNWSGQSVQMFSSQYQQYNSQALQAYGPNRYNDSQARVIQQRRIAQSQGT